MCEVALVHTHWPQQRRASSFFVLHLPALLGDGSGLEHRHYLTSCLEFCETLGSTWSSWCTPKHHIYLILGLIFLLLRSSWDSLTLTKDQH